ncbi:OmcA/MtrC family decaheme c-type cytochrome [Ferrimonas sp. SCSIO 43195]|nr:OmcA/MtrC family decaheme c-type cytochrome [Ferrimonas sp. SCSIO 43195]
MRMTRKAPLALLIASALMMAGCSDGDDGKDGAPGQPGDPGQPGEPGLPAGSFADTIESAAEMTITLLPENLAIAAGQPFSVAFSVTGKNAKGEDVPFLGMDKVALYVLNQQANDAGGAPKQWVNHVMANEAGYYMYCTPEGKTLSWGNEVNACTLVEDEANPGTYTGTWSHEGPAPVILASASADDLHRVFMRAYNVVNAAGVGIADKIFSSPLDYIPATGELAQSDKDTVSNAACIQCHGEQDGRIANIEAHHNYQKVENCVACHNPALSGGQDDPAIGWNADFGPMVHTIHGGHKIHTILGKELTGEAHEMFGEIGFPSELNECTVCHDGEPSWQTNVYAEACQACHIDFRNDDSLAVPHAGIDAAACSGCHTTEWMSSAHNVGDRTKATASIAAQVVNVVYSENSEAVDVDGTIEMQDKLTVTLAVQQDGSDVADGFDFGPYAKYSTLMVGSVVADGTVTKNTDVDFAGAAAAAGEVEASAIGNLNLDGQSLYLASRLSLCSKDGALIECYEGGDDTKPQYEVGYVAVTMDTAYWNLANADGSDALVSRFSQPDRITADEAKCNNCHDTLANAKHYGNLKFDQCMNCHNETWGGSYHAAVEYKSDDVDADGNPVFKTIDGLSYHTRDLFAVAHRFHTGLWDDNRGFPAIHLDSSMATQGYPDQANSCVACHKDDTALFAADGGLASGKRALGVDLNFDGVNDGYLSPVAEACRTCHAHSSPAALAHFKSNGSYVEGEPSTSADLPVESCGTCHAEGKTYGIDVMHAGGAH